MTEIDTRLKQYRAKVEEVLSPLVFSHYPSLVNSDRGNEYRKMLAVSTKMAMVGHGCTEIAGYPFDERRQRISSLFGACCFLGDSFLDDFGEEASREYIERYELLLTQGWFEIRNEREQLFYIVLSRLFAERDILDPLLRQAMCWLFLAQKRDVELSLSSAWLHTLPRRRRLAFLKHCCRDRSGHAITVLTLLLVPRLPLHLHHLLFTAGSLISFVDDHGDYYFDHATNKLTYMNQVKNPQHTLRRLFRTTINQLRDGLPECGERNLLMAFLLRYFTTRLKKHQLEKHKSGATWTIYE